MPSFPLIPRDITVEMDVGGTWTDVTSKVYGRDPLTISRGRTDEASQVDPSRLTMTLNNRDGRFSPRNPMGAYYGLIGRNTPVRVSVKRGAMFMELPGDNGDEATAPDAAALGITGDIDIRIDLSTSNWRGLDLCGKYLTTGNQRSWALQINGDGTLVLRWSTDGTSTSVGTATSTLPIPASPVRRAVRVTLDVNNGASGNTCTFYTSSSISGSWTQLGAAVVQSGITNIFDGTGAVEVGDVTGLTAAVDGTPSAAVEGKVHAFELRSGIGGTVVANPAFTGQAAGATSFADTASSPNTWTMQGNASITNRLWRFHGEMATLPSRWDISGRDVYVPAEAAGITRRIGAAGTPLRSALYRGILGATGLVSYWPCEDGSNSKLIASGLPGGRPMTPSAPPSFGSSDAFEASESLPTVANTSWAGPVAVYTPTLTAQVRFLISVPSGGTTNGAVIARILTTGTAARWDLTYSTSASGSIGFTVYDSDGNSIKTNSGFGPLNGVPQRLSFELTQSGSNISVSLISLQPGHSTGGGLSDSVTGRTFSRIKTVLIDPTTNVDDVAIGHISVHSQITSIFDVKDELTGWIGETAGRRIERLCGEEGITFRGIGDLDDTVAMGVQRPGALLDLLRECEDADLGTLFEPREVLGIGYRTRASLYNQDAAVAIDYAAHELSDALNPVDDDQAIHNSVTVSRTGGGSARVDITDGPLSTQAPPDGVGTYSDQPSVSLVDDEQCAYQASWRAHLGTVDEARYPQLPVAYHSNELVANPTLVRQLLESEVGDRVTVTHPPSWLPPDQISQLLQGTTETFTNFLHDATLNCSPASPYEIAVYGTDRYDTAGSALNSGCTSTATSISVKTNLGPIWTTAAGDMPFDIAVGGEQMTVTAISGASSPQTFTVTRSVNGLVKAHVTDEDVRLYAPTYREL
jgi:hypothetical protein